MAADVLVDCHNIVVIHVLNRNGLPDYTLDVVSWEALREAYCKARRSRGRNLHASLVGVVVYSLALY